MGFCRSILVVLCSLFAGLITCAYDDTYYERPPISYSESIPADVIAKLQTMLNSKETTLERKGDQGYLLPLLERLNVPISSQVLVFSKTSVQKNKISAAVPRAIYFNDDVYVGWVKNSSILEFASVDPKLGAIFYTMNQIPDEKPRFIRQTHNCLQCHDSSASTMGVPGLSVRSIYPDDDGEPRFQHGGFRTNYRSPFKERWGGWYVTGTHGSMRHMGNVTFTDKIDDKSVHDLSEKGANLTNLKELVDLSKFPAETSDIVALMVLEHQAYVHNLITRANFDTRLALLQNAEISKMTRKPESEMTDGTRSRIRAVCDPLIEALLFCDEATLTSPVKGISSFQADFEKRGPFDAQKRSLRQFDLSTRMFKYPCSYLVYSASFHALPKVAKDYVLNGMKEVLSGKNTSKVFGHLSSADRTAIAEILNETLPEWKETAEKRP